MSKDWDKDKNLRLLSEADFIFCPMLLMNGTQLLTTSNMTSKVMTAKQHGTEKAHYSALRRYLLQIKCMCVEKRLKEEYVT